MVEFNTEIFGKIISDVTDDITRDVPIEIPMVKNYWCAKLHCVWFLQLVLVSICR